MRKKNKLFLAIAGLTTLLFAAGALLVVDLHSIAVEALQTSLLDFSKQAEQAVSTETQGNLNVLNALSDLDAFSDSRNSPDKDRILNREASQNTFRFLAYSDLSGRAVTNKNVTLQLGKRSYFQKALAGKSSISYDYIDADNNRKEIIYCVPVIRSHQVRGVLAAAAQDSSRFSGLESITAERDITVWILQKDGTVIAGEPASSMHADFFSASGISANESLMRRLKSNFANGVSGTASLRLNGANVQTAYLPVAGSDGWILWASKANGGIFGNDRALVPVAVLRLCGFADQSSQSEGDEAAVCAVVGRM